LPGLPVGGGFAALTVALSGRVLAFEWAGEGVLWRAERQTVVRIERPALFDRLRELVAQVEERPLVQLASPPHEAAPQTAVWGKRRHPGDPDGRPASVSPTAPRDSGPMRLNLPVASPVLQVCHDDAGWCVESSTFEYSPASLVLT